jgi:hypothetical protein
MLLLCSCNVTVQSGVRRVREVNGMPKKKNKGGGGGGVGGGRAEGGGQGSAAAEAAAAEIITAGATIKAESSGFRFAGEPGGPGGVRGVSSRAVGTMRAAASRWSRGR